MFGNGHEEVVKHLKQDRIGLRAKGGVTGFGGRAIKDQVSGSVDPRGPAGFDDVCACRLGYDRGAADDGVGRKGGAVKQRHVLWTVVHDDVQLGQRHRVRGSGRCRGRGGFGFANRLDRDHVDQQGPVG